MCACMCMCACVHASVCECVCMCAYLCACVYVCVLALDLFLHEWFTLFSEAGPLWPGACPVDFPASSRDSHPCRQQWNYKHKPCQLFYTDSRGRTQVLICARRSTNQGVCGLTGTFCLSTIRQDTLMMGIICVCS